MDDATATATPIAGKLLDTTDFLKVTPSGKPGYKTTEFYLKLAAVLLTALYASDVIPTSGPATKIAAIAATMLGALGYTVVRGMVKTGGNALVLIFALVLATTTACDGQTVGNVVRNPVVAPVVDCVKADQGALVDMAHDLSPLVFGDKPDWTALYERAKHAGAQIGGCVLADLVQKYLSAKSVAQGDVDDTWMARDALEHFRTAVAGGATFHTAAGDL